MKTHKKYICHVRNRGDLGGKRKSRIHEKVGSVAANTERLDNTKEAVGNT